MRRRRAPFVLIACFALASCTAKAGPPRAAGAGRPAAAASKKPSAVAPKSSAPEVRMFAGVASEVGTLVQFCKAKTCSVHPALTARLPIVEGSIVTFAVDAAPDLAVLDVSGTGARRVSLAAATLMAFQGRLAPGSHRLTLQLRWGSSSGTWVYDVSVRPKS
jgi:hypothetical protein